MMDIFYAVALRLHDSCMQESKNCCIIRIGSCSLSVFCTNEKKERVE